MTKQELKVSEAEAKASLYSGGLVGVMAVMGAVTERNSLAMLRQQYLIAKYGLASPSPALIASKQISKAESNKSAKPVTGESGNELREQILDYSG